MKLLLQVLGIILFVISFGAMVAMAMPKAEVRVSYSTQKCVEVVPAEAGDCNNLPKRYTHIWVK